MSGLWLRVHDGGARHQRDIRGERDLAGGQSGHSHHQAQDQGMHMQRHNLKKILKKKIKLQILEPRESRTSLASQVSVEMEGEEERRMKMHEEERRLMILRQLQILTNKKIIENADVDHSIHLLQVSDVKKNVQSIVSQSHNPFRTFLRDFFFILHIKLYFE